MLGGLLLFGMPGNGKAAQIIIKAEATQEYTKAAAKRGPENPLTYHLVKGYFYPGNIADSSLQRVDFMEIARNLAMHLANQNFFPGKESDKNDLMIIVHWGVTAVEEDITDLWGIHSMDEYEELYGLGDSSDEGVARKLELYGPTDVPDWGLADRRKNSGMLGFEETLQSSNSLPQDQYELESALNRERYFLVVMAYDYQKYRKDKEMDLQWITRFSMKATGNNFENAYKELTFAASDYFGKNMKGLQKKRTEDTSKVDIGDIEVLDTVEKETP